MRSTKSIHLSCALVMLGLCAIHARAEEDPNDVRITPDKVQQLKRMEPLTKEKLKVLWDGGQLTKEQYIMIRGYTNDQGILNVPATHIGTETRVTPAREPDSSVLVRRPDGSLDVMAWIKADDLKPLGTLSDEDRQRVHRDLRAFGDAGRGTREDIMRALKGAGPAVNTIVAQFYTEPIDLIHKIELWGAVARRSNPRAAGYIASTHQKVMDEGQPVLIAYEKDVGGLIFRRRSGGQLPKERWYSSRDIRDSVVDLEKYISRCSGVRAAVYLMDVYAARYEADIAPMRDKSRDRMRMVQVCGGDHDEFDQDEPGKWGSTLGALERALIAERLIPFLRSDSGSVRHIAMNGLLIALGVQDKKMKDRLEDAHKKWPAFLQFWQHQRDLLLSGN